MADVYQQLWKAAASTNDEGKAVRTLARILLDKEGRSFILRLERNDAELCVELLDRGIAEHNLRATEKQAFFTTLRRLAGIHGRLPESMMVAENIDVSEKILANGGFADVRTGTYKGRLVAVKSMRVSEQDDLGKLRKQFCREVVLWNTLTHPNVLKLVGVMGDMEKGQFITVSEWMEHGNIMQYIGKTHVNRLELLHGAAKGLKYLHSASLVHGDLKGANILMSNDNPPRACLADFGFMTMVLDPNQPMSCSAGLEGGTVMFMSPELLVPGKFGFTEAVPTKEGDIYAFGLVIWQVLTGEIPFAGLRMAEIAMNAVNGVRPHKPEQASDIGFTDLLWEFTQRCWDGEIKLRPEIADVEAQLGKVAANWNRVMPPCAQQVKEATPISQEPVSESMAHWGIFQSSSGIAPASPTDSQAVSTLSDSSNTQSVSTQYTEPSSVEAQEVVAKLFDRPQPEPQLPTPEDPNDDVPEVHPHLGEQYNPPPSNLPKRKRTSLRRLKKKFREFFRWP